ncbi:MAG TPA: fluoride efflux transporter CrcB [Nitrospiraceae bacterium]|jgi:CrcB protein|nr:fluoride efflux transporter CrcB [Nitrospiraceae bacterium]
MVNYLIIGVGGFPGAATRFFLATWIGQKWGRNFPLGTFVINVSGSFFIGLLMTLLTEKFMANPQWKLLLVVGFLGAYTTFSTFEFETSNLLISGDSDNPVNELTRRSYSASLTIKHIEAMEFAFNPAQSWQFSEG